MKFSIFSLKSMMHSGQLCNIFEKESFHFCIHVHITSEESISVHICSYLKIHFSIFNSTPENQVYLYPLSLFERKKTCIHSQSTFPVSEQSRKSAFRQIFRSFQEYHSNEFGAKWAFSSENLFFHFQLFSLWTHLMVLCARDFYNGSFSEFNTLCSAAGSILLPNMCVQSAEVA